MTNQSWMYGVMVLAGIGIPVMAAMNGALGLRVGAPAAATSMFVFGGICAAVITLATGGFPMKAFMSAPPWLYLAGLAVVFYILSITMLGPKIGIGTAVLCVLLGQILSAALIDHFGWFGAPRSPITLKKLVGLAFMVIGIWLARRTI